MFLCKGSYAVDVIELDLGATSRGKKVQKCVQMLSVRK